jgi:hypothetical protein
MTSTQITALHAAGVWPGMLNYDTGGAFYSYEHGEWTVLPTAAAEALLIVEMMERLPDEWYITKFGDYWELYAPGDNIVVDEVFYTNKFEVLFSALVVAGIVKETK